MDELKKNSQIYLRRFKKEKRYRRKLQEQLEMETKRRVQMEEALRMTSSETMKRITESLTRSSAAPPSAGSGLGDPRISAGDQEIRDRDSHQGGPGFDSPSVADKMVMMNALSSPANGGPVAAAALAAVSSNNGKDRRDSGDDQRSSPASSSTSNVAIGKSNL